MGLGREEIVNQLQQVKLPRESGLHGDLVSADLVRALSVKDGKVSFVIEAPSPQVAAHLAGIRDQAQAVLQKLPGVQAVSVVLTAHGPAQQSAPPDLKPRQPAQAQRQGIAGVEHIIAVGSGKGGVGKSTVTSNLAVALARQGLRVGLLDADLYGPSQPRMLGVERRPDLTKDNRLVPLLAHGVKMMSIGLLVEADQPLAWRGAMLNKALQQLLNDVEWGALDVLLIDLPPGTGDVQLTLGQRIDLTGALIVSTPQDVALIDATRAISMFQKFDTPVLGLIENMSSYICPNCQHEAHIFGHGGVRNEAERLGVPYLGDLPLDLEVRLGGDNGVPVAAGQGPLADAYARLARHLMDKGLV
ncbi:MAG: sodium:proton antiporter [Rhodobacterales bacterium]|nr:MAG: sodium:proton antiporter [Rhodobacterales bacterium]